MAGRVLRTPPRLPDCAEVSRRMAYTAQTADSVRQSRGLTPGTPLRLCAPGRSTCLFPSRKALLSIYRPVRLVVVQIGKPFHVVAKQLLDHLGGKVAPGGEVHSLSL